MRGASVILRRLVSRRAPCLASRSSSIGDSLLVSSAAAAASYSTLIVAEDAQPLLASVAASGAVSALHPFFMNRSRNFSSAASSDSSKVVSVESEEQFNDSVRKAEEESQAAIFYFTAAWCGPFLSLSAHPMALSKYLMALSTFGKVQKGLENAVSKLNIHSVPTLHFFKNGKKADEVIGADVELLKNTMEALYK
ncbi:hypothetical protein SASPL_144496 [Salvia splendens]|uniref:Thioredoxin domain-containing protein n=1 Tax=Salvia splendens TaxID=180675 RepID=A0A8X8VXI5_SALSN|nr:hypothetical protein SASPL_156056 [Salvia splendens]KAG6393921.1 hypothetical protein SASPL_144496 [Salvia splendens]